MPGGRGGPGGLGSGERPLDAPDQACPPRPQPYQATDPGVGSLWPARRAQALRLAKDALSRPRRSKAQRSKLRPATPIGSRTNAQTPYWPAPRGRRPATGQTRA